MQNCFEIYMIVDDQFVLLSVMSRSKMLLTLFYIVLVLNPNNFFDIHVFM